MNTRSPAMSPEEAERIIAEAQRRGAIIRMEDPRRAEDPRLSGIIRWIWPAIGATAIAGIMALISGQAKTNEQIAEINKNIAVMIQRQEFVDRTNSQQDRHMEATDAKIERNSDRISVLERSAQVLGGKQP